MILRKIIKIVATRSHILKLQCAKFDFSWDSAPNSVGGALYAPPDRPAGCYGSYFYGEEGEEKKEKDKRWKKRKGKEERAPNSHF